MVLIYLKAAIQISSLINKTTRLICFQQIKFTQVCYFWQYNLGYKFFTISFCSLRF